MTKKYKENLKEIEKKQKNETPVNNNTITEEKPTESTNVSAETDNKKKTADKGKIGNFFKKTKGKTKTGDQKTKEKQENEGNQEKKEKNEDNASNFLKKNNGEDVKWGDKKTYQEDEIGKTLNAKGFKDLVNTDGKFDVNKMNEDQYNQLRLLKNLNKLANNDNNPDSDESESLSMSASK